MPNRFGFCSFAGTVQEFDEYIYFMRAVDTIGPSDIARYKPGEMEWDRLARLAS